MGNGCDHRTLAFTLGFDGRFASSEWPQWPYLSQHARHSGSWHQRHQKESSGIARYIVRRRYSGVRT
jgi:hypothetical protein